MKHLSLWGKHNPVKARLLIIFAHFYLGFVLSEIGIWTYAQGLHLPAGAFLVPLLAFSLAYIFYPSRRGLYTASYARRKTFDGVLIMTIGLMWFAAGNRLPVRLELTNASTMPSRNTSVSMSMLPREGETTVLQKTGESKIKTWLKSPKKLKNATQQWMMRRMEHRLSAYDKEGSSNGEAALIIILGIIVSLLVAYIALVLACQLSCNGNDIAAVLVVIVGLGLLTGMWIVFIRWIRRVKGRSAGGTGS
jgi:hypothetical protein